MEEGHHQPPVDEDDDEIPLGEGGDTPKNLFGSARDAVLSIVKKVCEVKNQLRGSQELSMRFSEANAKNTTMPIFYYYKVIKISTFITILIIF